MFPIPPTNIILLELIYKKIMSATSPNFLPNYYFVITKLPLTINYLIHYILDNYFFKFINIFIIINYSIFNLAKNFRFRINIYECISFVIKIYLNFRFINYIDIKYIYILYIF